MSKFIEIFKAGNHTDANGKVLNFSDDDLKTIVANYDPQLHEAPLVIGHPKMDAPAYGWVGDLSTDGKLLNAKPTQVDAQFAELVEKGRYKKISASFYLPGAAGNPKPEGYYLRHVGFLGAKSPAIKGLKPVEFNEAEDGFVEFNEVIQTPPAENADSTISEELTHIVMPQKWGVWRGKESEPHGFPDITSEDIIHNINKEEEPMTAEEKQRMADLEAENKALKAKEAQRAKEKAEAENANFAEGLIKEGKLLPKSKDKLLAVLNTDTSTADFAEDDFKSNLKDFLNDLPQVVDFSEAATKDKAAESADESVEYAEGTDPDRIVLDQKARAYMAEHKCDYETAIDAVV